MWISVICYNLDKKAVTDMSGVVHCQPGGDGEKHLDVVQWQPGDKNHLTVKKGSMESPQK